MEQPHGQEVRLHELIEPGAKIRARSAGQRVTISANRAGLVTLSRLCLYLTQKSARAGTGVALDASLGLDGSSGVSLVLERE